MKTETAQRGESSGVLTQVLLVLFCLVAGIGYRASVSLVPSGIAEDAFVLVAAAVLLAIALLAKRTGSLRAYWEIPFAFFVFYVAAFFGDGNISPLQHWFVRDVLHESTSSNNPLASTVTGSVLAQLFGTVILAIPIIVLTIAAGGSLASIFLAWPKSWWPIAIGVASLAVFWFLALRGRTESFFAIHGELSTSRFLALTPALLVLVLLNGFREEIFFRALFLNKYGMFLRPILSNLLAAVIFTSFHVQVTYAASVLIFLGYTLIIGLVAGWLMQRSGSLLSSVLFHAGTDIPIFLVYLTWAQS